MRERGGGEGERERGGEGERERGREIGAIRGRKKWKFHCICVGRGRKCVPVRHKSCLFVVKCFKINYEAHLHFQSLKIIELRIAET